VLNYLFSLLESTRDNGLAADICDALGQIGDKSAFVPLLRVTQGDFLNYVKERAQIAISKLQWNESSVFDQ
jgi:HEAT repeat protein